MLNKNLDKKNTALSPIVLVDQPVYHGTSNEFDKQGIKVAIKCLSFIVL